MGYEYGYGYASSRKKIYVIGWVYQSMKILKLESLFLLFSSFLFLYSFPFILMLCSNGIRWRERER